MRDVLLLPFALLLILIAIAVTLHADSPAHESTQVVVLEAELPVVPSASDGGSPQIVSDFAHDHYAPDLTMIETDRTHVVQWRHESLVVSFDTDMAISSAAKPRHLLSQAVGAAGVWSMSHPSPISQMYPCDYGKARPQDIGGLA